MTIVRAAALFLLGQQAFAAPVAHAPSPGARGGVLPGKESAAPPVAVSGYVKDLWQYSRSAVDGRPYFINISRQRLTLDASRAAFKAHVDYDHEQSAGSYFRTREYGVFGLAEPGGFLDTEQTISTASTALWRHRLYRWWAGIETDTGVLRFGRQRIAWGTGKLFNPTDVLNPYNPFSTEKDERPGVDALYRRESLGELSQFEIVWTPERRWSSNGLLGRIKTNWLSFDLAAMGGKTSPSTSSWIVGGDFAGNVADGTFRGEWAYADPGPGMAHWKLALGYDYAFTGDAALPGFKDLSLMVEYYHNGAGSADIFKYDVLKALAGREITLARDYAGFGVSKDLHPLVKLDATVVLNLNDSSWFAGPALTWDVGRNLLLAGGFHRYGGPALTEYGRIPNRGFLQAEFHF